MNSRLARHRLTKGFSLIELLVSMLIGLIVTLAVTSVLIRSEGSKRSSTSVNDINQTGAYAAFVMDRAIRSAGSGFSQRWSDVYGCLLDVSKGSTHVLPLPSAIAATSAFVNVKSATLPLRLAPVIIGKGLADTTGAGAETRGDLLLVMAGTAGVGESPQTMLAPTSPPLDATNFRLQTVLGYSTGDMLLLNDTSASTSCMMQQAGTIAAHYYGQSLPLDGTYYAANGTNVNLSAFGSGSLALQMGRDVANPPQFQAYAVGANRTLFSYDMLQSLPANNVPDVPIADGVVEMRALYGVDTTNPLDGVLDSWVDPVAGSGFEASVLTDGTPASRLKLRQIVAIRVGFILRTSLQERSAANSASGVTAQETFQQTNSTVKLFNGVTNAAGTSITYSRSLTSADTGYRFRTVEVTIPLRNVLMAPQS